MQGEYQTLLNNALFRGFSQEDLQSILQCLSYRRQHYTKKEYILMQGDEVHSIGILLRGSAYIVSEDYEGGITIRSRLAGNDLFGEAFAYAGVVYSPVSVRAEESCDVLFVVYRSMITTCGKGCHYHNRLIENMLRLVAEKNIFLNQKMDILSKKTLRERIMVYLLQQNRLQVGATMQIPFSREEMAQYLSADRSALSRELGRMKAEGLIWYHKNQFRLLS